MNYFNSDCYQGGLDNDEAHLAWLKSKDRYGSPADVRSESRRKARLNDIRVNKDSCKEE